MPMKSDEHANKAPLHDDPDESDDENDDMLEDFKKMLEKFTWTEVPPTDPPTLADETPWDGRHQHYDINSAGSNVTLFQTTELDWNEKHLVYLADLALFVNLQMKIKMLTATNAYGEHYIRGWKNITAVEELLVAFLGIVIYMGIYYIFPTRRKYWTRGNKGDRWVQGIMSREKRFEQILKAWHVENYGAYIQAEIKVFKTEGQ